MTLVIVSKSELKKIHDRTKQHPELAEVATEQEAVLQLLMDCDEDPAIQRSMLKPFLNV